jgi:hypothetical protein
MAAGASLRGLEGFSEGIINTAEAHSFRTGPVRDAETLAGANTFSTSGRTVEQVTPAEWAIQVLVSFPIRGPATTTLTNTADKVEFAVSISMPLGGDSHP